ncbi:MAG: Uma2 family endonuclease [Polyangiaceae bacterium]|nr:Uma2 family endonuclease [Polyangiaceae bacterium]
MPETKRHLEARTTLYLLLKDALSGAAIGSDQFVYFDASDPRKCLAPDVFVKRGVPETTFDNWKTWERGAPDLAVEIVSETDRRDADWEGKLARYQACGVHEVVRFDPEGDEPSLRVWDRIDGELVERDMTGPNLRECQALHLWWVVVPSMYGPMLRLARDPDGSGLLPTVAEERAQLGAALAEERKARALAEHEKMLAEHEKMLAEQKKMLAEQKARDEANAREEAERARAEVEADNERLRAELDRLRSERR